jgi:hypothetical protein
VREIHAAGQGLDRRRAEALAPKRRPQLDQRVGVVQPGRRRREQASRFCERVGVLPNRPEVSQRDADRVLAAPTTLQLELFLDELIGMLVLAAAGEERAGEASPGRCLRGGL